MEHNIMHRHDLELLANDHGYCVQYCHACDIVHLDLGPVTLRLRPGALEALTEVLSRSTARLHQRADDGRRADVIDIRNLLAS
jgi:hypothetical protein